MVDILLLGKYYQLSQLREQNRKVQITHAEH